MDLVKVDEVRAETPELSSHPCMMCLRERPTSFGPSPMEKRTFVARTTSSRTPSSARPVISSETPFEYTSAVSIKLPPASRNRPTICLEVSSSSLLPEGHAPRAQLGDHQTRVAKTPVLHAPLLPDFYRRKAVL